MSAKDLFYSPSKAFSKAEEKADARESLIYNLTEDLLILLENKGVSKAELAKALSKSKSFVTQTLSGSRNMTLGTLSNICFELGVAPSFTFTSVSKAEKEGCSWESIKVSYGGPISSRVKKSNVVDIVDKQWERAA